MQQELDLLHTPYQRCEPSRRCRLEAALDCTLPTDTIDVHRCRDPSQRVDAKVLGREIPPDQPVRVGTDQDDIRRGQSLNTGCDVGRIAQGKLFLVATTAHLAYDDKSRVDTDADGQMDTFLLL